MSSWWVVQNFSVTPNTFTVTQANTAPTGSHTVVPYPDQASAQAAATALDGSAQSGVAGTVTGDILKLTGVTAVAAAMEHFTDTITDVTMWRSLGWLALGIALLFIGAALWLKKPIEAGIGTIAGAAIKAP